MAIDFIQENEQTPSMNAYEKGLHPNLWKIWDLFVNSTIQVFPNLITSFFIQNPIHTENSHKDLLINFVVIGNTKVHLQKYSLFNTKDVENGSSYN